MSDENLQKFDVVQPVEQRCGPAKMPPAPGPGTSGGSEGAATAAQQHHRLADKNPIASVPYEWVEKTARSVKTSQSFPAASDRLAVELAKIGVIIRR